MVWPWGAFFVWYTGACREVSAAVTLTVAAMVSAVPSAYVTVTGNVYSRTSASRGGAAVMDPSLLTVTHGGVPSPAANVVPAGTGLGAGRVVVPPWRTEPSW